MKKRMMTFLTGALIIAAFTNWGNYTSAAESSFKDVPTSHWAKNAIDYAVSKGYLKGEGNGNFRPNAAVTRAEFAAILDRVSTNEIKEGAGSFSDLNGHWSEKEVNEAVGKGFIKPADYPDGFKPGTELKRIEMAKWMAEGLAKADSDYRKALDDTKDTLVPVAEYYKGGLDKAEYPYVSVALGTGLMTGYNDGTFGPSKTTTRAEVATILMRYENTQSKKANSFRDLNEMREVGLTGTNLTSLTPHRYVINKETKEEYSFDKVRDIPMNLSRNLGTEVIHRMIVVDATIEGRSNNIYGRMFLDKSFNGFIREDRYLIFIEATIKPRENNLDNLAFVVANPNIFLNGTSFSTSTDNKYGLSPLPSGKHFILDKVFTKDVPKRFWMMRSINKKYTNDNFNNGASFDVEGKIVSFRIPKD
ncbi:S-layer homology domain-containing protein [Paenibacillus azoreducens]|uniref:S-layer homology domain-containing protein n=1 Tax=Paenibacillus azoreducens TaxID=116718 RepID=UPI0039F45318